MIIIFIIINTQIIGLLAGVNDIYCNNASQCVNQQINTTGWVLGRGYKSISGQTTSITDAYAVSCDGAFACNKLSLVSNRNDVYCYGSNSCKNISLIKTNGVADATETYCYGSNSCSYSNVRTKEGPGYVYCQGDQSCAYTNIEQHGYIYGRGAYSLYNARINSNGTLSIIIDLVGYNAGFGAKIICSPSTHNCTITCHGNACYMTYIECNNNCIINKIPNSTIANATTIHPITDIDQFNDNTFNLLYDSQLLTINNDNQCNQQPNTTLYDNYQQHYIGSNIVINGPNGGAICCRGQQSCRQVNTINMNIETQLQQYDIVCSGRLGCADVTTINNNGANVFCEGWDSCEKSNIITNNNIYCLGHTSCWQSHISDAQNVFCSGGWACRLTTITSSGDINIYLLAQESGKDITIYCNGNDNCFLLCGTFDACIGATFYCYGNCTIQCESGYQCPQIITPPPTTAEPTTSNPTSNPTTSNPTTSDPTPSDPTTSDPTNQPTTSNPTYIPTSNPTTSSPTESPITSLAITSEFTDASSPLSCHYIFTLLFVFAFSICFQK